VILIGEKVVGQSITPQKIRKIIIEQSKRARVGHIGSALSIADIIAVLFGKIIHLPGTKDPARDRFILSKGHAVLAVYAALYMKGILSADQLNSYSSDGTFLGEHPEHSLDGIELSTGSLGHGLSIGAGMALAIRMRGGKARVYVLVSDAECNEGSVWESVMFAAQHRLSNLVVIVDNNGQQALGKTVDVINLNPLQEKWRAFGWDTYEADGHNTAELESVLSKRNAQDGPPTAVIAKTIAGKGVSFMEGQVAWHYLPLNDEQYARSLKEIEGTV
jgi:transketolase